MSTDSDLSRSQNPKEKLQWKIEIFSENLNSWISFTIEEFYSVLRSSSLTDEDELFSIQKIPSLSVKPAKCDIHSQDFKIKNGDYIEFSRTIFCEIYFDISNHKLIIKDEASAKFKQHFQAWVRAKVISVDPSNKDYYLVEYEDSIYQIDSKQKIRKLYNEHTNTFENSFLFLEAISNVPQKLFSSLHEILENVYNEYLEREEVLVIISKRENILFIQEIIELKRKENEEMEKYNSEIEREKENLSKLNTILKTSQKEIYIFHKKFMDEIDQKIKNFKEIQYTILSNEYEDDENKKDTCTLIIFSNDRKILSETIKKLPLKQVIITSPIIKSDEELKPLITKSKVEHYYYDLVNNNLYILGTDKSLNDFKILWNITMKYSQKIEETKKESESIKKELSTLKKQYNLK